MERKGVVGKREIAIDTAACLNWRFFACWSELGYWLKTSQEYSRFFAEPYTIKFDEIETLAFLSHFIV